MKEDILKRAMFAMPLSKASRNSGIMSGFDMDEMEDMDENADLEEMPPMARTPQNPEILMNNLRGDMRSVDARYMELAQMVGEEAAMETPPEVLAMLQPQLAAQQQQQGGIGSLPQAQGMPGGAPSGAPGMPGQAGPQPGMAMPQGGAQMPPGMAGAGPFPSGAEAAPQGYAHGGMVAPHTPDGMPPMHAAVGAFITPATRAAQFLSDKAGAVNAALGRMYMSPSMTQPVLENVRGPGGRFTAQQVVGGGDLIYPTFTQGLAQNVSRLAEQYPRLSAMLPAGLGAAGAKMVPGGNVGSPTPAGSVADQIPVTTREEYMRQAERLNQPPAMAIDMSSPEAGKWTTTRAGEKPQPFPFESSKMLMGYPEEPYRPEPEAAEAAPAVGATSEDRLGDFIAQKLKAQEARDAAKAGAVTPKTKMQRIKEGVSEYTPLFQELMGEDKEAAKTNALLLLAEAGFNLASTREPTFGMALAKSLAGVPKGFAAIAAQERELGMKIKGAALQQAISDVDTQDKYAQALQLEMLKGDMKILAEQAKKGGTITEDGGAGLRVVKTRDGGSFVGTGIDAQDPTVQSAVQSRFTLRDTDNPFVENRGQAPTSIETDKSERVKLTNTLRSLDNSLSTLDNLKGVYANAYGPGAWFQDKVNNLLVPVLPNTLVKPNFDVADASTRIQTGMNSIQKNIASANDGGRVAVQEQEWVRPIISGAADPVKFFQDKELAAKQFNSLEALLRNARQQVLTQLGYEKNDYVMRTPSTGTQSDPFVISSDPAQQKLMYTFLGSTIGKLQDPSALVYLRLPNGRVDAFNPVQLRALNQ